MFLGYHTDDFKHTGSYADAATTTESSNSWHQAPLSSLYNGNIGAWQWGSRTSTGYKENLASRYRYDLLNRIRVDTLSTRVSNTWTATPNYRSSYTYDGNGNLKSLVRVDSAGTLMDSLVYRYQTNRSRLTHVDDPGGVASNHSFDVDDQDTNTYTYDASGNMIGDTASGITSIVWTPSNKIQSITKGSTSKLEYTYDAMGNRVVKRYYQPTSTLKSTTWYARDAQGNILSVYERPHADSAIKQSEVHIYGSSRLGIEQRGITYSTSNYAWIGSEQHRNAGSKRYELTDHLGNVRVTISDLLIARPTGFGDTTQDAEVIDRRDYYPFGMEMPGRRWRATGEDAARFGFNGKENDNEVKGEGNQQDYGFRIYDPRIARFLSVDPLSSKFPTWSSYQMSGCSPIALVDREGDEWVVAFIGANNPRGRFQSTIKAIFSDKLESRIDDGGRVTLHFLGSNTVQSLDAYQQAAFNSLSEVIGSTTTTRQNVYSASTEITVDSYGTTALNPAIDIHDIQQVGRLMQDNRYSAALLVHAAIEAFSRFKSGFNYSVSHRKGKDSEGPILGMQRHGEEGSDGRVEVSQSDASGNGVLTGKLVIPYSSNGTIKTLEIGIANGLVSTAQLVVAPPPTPTTTSGSAAVQTPRSGASDTTVAPTSPNSSTPPVADPSRTPP